MRKLTILIFAITAIIVFSIVFRVGLANGDTTAPASLRDFQTKTDSIVEKIANVIKNAYHATTAWLKGIGIDFPKIIHIVGDLIIALFDALTKLGKWIISSVRQKNL